MRRTKQSSPATGRKKKKDHHTITQSDGDCANDTPMMMCVLLLVVLVLFVCQTVSAGGAALPETCAGWPLPNGYGAGGSAMGAPPPPPGAPTLPWASVGNHRFEVRVTEMPAEGEAVRAIMPWARHDMPNGTAIVVLSSATSLAVKHCTTLSADSQSATIVFSANDGPGLYHVYYMPFTTCEYGTCEYGASASYKRSEQPVRCDDNASDWLTSSVATLAVAERIQSRTAFDGFGEMELAATQAQVQTLLQHASGGALLVTEERANAVRMTRHLPRSWATRSVANLATFSGVASPGEHFNFQVALVAVDSNLTIVRASASSGLAALAPVCMNLEGSDFWGRPYEPSDAAMQIAEGEVRSFYFATVVPADAAGKSYSGQVSLHSSTGQSYSASVSISVTQRKTPLRDGGDGDIWRETR